MKVEAAGGKGKIKNLKIYSLIVKK